MRRVLTIAAVVAGALATALFTLFATTFGDCGPDITVEACERGKDEALRVGMPVALLLYAAFVAAVRRWPRILRWPRP